MNQATDEFTAKCDLEKQILVRGLIKGSRSQWAWPKSISLSASSLDPSGHAEKMSTLCLDVVFETKAREDPVAEQQDVGR